MEPPADEAPIGTALAFPAPALPVTPRASAAKDSSSLASHHECDCPSPCLTSSAPPSTLPAETVSVAGEPAVEEESPALSAIEKLPTEIVQHLASYLIHEDDETEYNHYDSANIQRCAPSGILNLRTTSRTLQTKTEYVFAQCFTVKIVTFDLSSLARLVQLSRSPAYSPLVRDLVFLAARHGPPAMNQSSDEDHLSASINEDLAVEGMGFRQAKETTLLIMALNGFLNVKTIIIGRSLQDLYPARVRQSSLAKHAPSMILAATVLGSLSLEHLYMNKWTNDAFHGVKPRILDNFQLEMNKFRYLKTIRLTLISRNCKSIKMLLTMRGGITN
jgi:hypothetical protein